MDTLSFHVDRFLDLIPSDGSAIDLQEPLHDLVRTTFELTNRVLTCHGSVS